MSDTIRLSGVTLNAPDAIALASFYALITGGVARGNKRWATVTGPNADIGFQQIDDFRPPVWPTGTIPMHRHPANRASAQHCRPEILTPADLAPLRSAAGRRGHDGTG